jgi:hypothetical protein
MTYIHFPIHLHGIVLNWLSAGTTLPLRLLNNHQTEGMRASGERRFYNIKGAEENDEKKPGNPGSGSRFEPRASQLGSRSAARLSATFCLRK